MIAPRLQRQLAAPFRKRINRAPSPFIARAVPWLTVFLGTLLPTWLTIASAPVLPPLGFLTLLAWRQLRPGLLPVWSGAILGFLDDLYSGQPVGSAVLTWSLALLAVELIEARFPWRNFAIDWLEATAIIASVLLISWTFANHGAVRADLTVLAPQLILSIMLYPLVARVVWLFDRLRLLPFRVLA